MPVIIDIFMILITLTLKTVWRDDSACGFVLSTTGRKSEYDIILPSLNIWSKIASSATPPPKLLYTINLDLFFSIAVHTI